MQFLNKNIFIINLIFKVKKILIGMVVEYVKKIFKISSMVKRFKI